MITIKELIKKLSEYPEDMPVVQMMYSDYQDFDLDGSIVTDMIKTSYGARVLYDGFVEKHEEKIMKCLVVDGN